MDHSRVTSDLRHMSDAGTCAKFMRSGIGALHRIPPSRVLSGPGSPRHPDSPSRGHTWNPHRKKRGAAVHPGHTPLPDTPRTVILFPLSKGRIKAERGQEKARRAFASRAKYGDVPRSWNGRTLL